MSLETAAVEVICDQSGSAGSFSYLRPVETEVSIGDAVRVTLGGREVDGIVIGAGNEEVATVPIQQVWGQRATGEDLALIAEIAKTSMCNMADLASRLMPADGKTAAPAHAGSVVEPGVANPLPEQALPDRAVLFRNPTVDPYHIAAWAAYDLASRTGQQVLVLCSSVAALRGVLRLLPSGAMDLRESGGWAGFQAGTVEIGVSTLTSALWSCPGLGGIVVVEEELSGHAEKKFPYTHARDIAQARAKFSGAQLRLISGAPSIYALAGGSKVVTVGGATNWANIIPLPVKRDTHWAHRVADDALVIPSHTEGQWRCVRCDRVPERTPLRISWLTGQARAVAPCHRCRTMKLKFTGWGKERCGNVFGEERLTQAARLGAGDSVVLAGWMSALSSRPAQPGHSAAKLLAQACSQVGESGTVYVPVFDTQDPLVKTLLERDLVGNAKYRWQLAVDGNLAPFTEEFEIWGRGATPDRPDFGDIHVHGPSRVGPSWKFRFRVPRGTDSTVIKNWIANKRGARIRFLGH